MATQYKVTKKTNIRKTAKSNGTVVTSVAKGTKIQISSISGNWAKISTSSNKVNNKSIGGYYIAKSAIEKVSSSKASTKSKSNSNHTGHEKKSGLKGKAGVNAYLHKSCDAKAGNTYIKKGTSVTINALCSKNNMLKVTGKASNGKKCTAWVSAISITMNSSTRSKLFSSIKSSMKKASTSQQQYVKSKAIASFVDKSSAKYNNVYYDELTVRNSNGILGMPYQFMPSVDMRTSDRSSFGRMYIDRIISRMPLLLLTPGVPDFAPGWKKSDRKTLVSALLKTMGRGGNGLSSGLDTLLKKGGRYYNFDFDYAGYYKYVNASLRYCAIVLGIGNIMHSTAGIVHTFGSQSLAIAGQGVYNANTPNQRAGKSYPFKSFKWQEAVNNKFNNWFNCGQYVAFYLDSETSISESIDNSTTTSSIGDTINSLGSTSKEIQFLAGPIAGLKIDKLKSSAYDEAQRDIENIADKHLNGSKLIKKAGEMFNTITKGGHIIFPELWNDSDFTKNYNISIKLRTPDGDKISWYLNILVPLMHIICMAAPHMMGPNGYSSPYLVRGFYKGIFNCDMGLITGCDITKGKEGSWNVDGLPTEIDVSLTIKDLYSALSIAPTLKISKATKNWKFFQNTALIDYLTCTCGVNINQMEIARIMEAYSVFTKNAFKDFFPDIWYGFKQGMNNVVLDVYNRLIGAV